MKQAAFAFFWGLIAGAALCGGEALIARFLPLGNRQALEQEIRQTALPQASIDKKIMYWTAMEKRNFPLVLVTRLKLKEKPDVPATFWAEFESAKKMEIEKLERDYKNDYYLEWVGLPLHQLVRARDHYKSTVTKKVADNRMKYQESNEAMDARLANRIKSIALEALSQSKASQ